MHIYQKHILDELRRSNELRYSELQPDGVESSHFKYHLDQLMQDGLVERVDRGVYTLSDKGKAAVDRLSDGRINPQQTPKVITYTLLKDTENYYLYRKDKEPFRGLLNMVAGKLHLDESAHDAAVREVSEKTSLQISEPELRAVANVRTHTGEQLLSHFIAYIYVAELQGDAGNLEKIPVAEFAERKDTAPDLVPIVLAIENNPSFQHLDLDLDL